MWTPAQWSYPVTSTGHRRVTASRHFSSARMLLFGGERKEWGISGGLRYRPGADGDGLALALYPSIGESSNSLGELFDKDFSFIDDVALTSNRSPLTARLQAQVAYGFRTGEHLLTPYIDTSLAATSSSYSAGLRYALANGLDLDLNASHRQRSSATNENRLLFQLRSDL